MQLHTASIGRLNRRVHGVGKQEICREWRPVLRSIVRHISACFAVPSCQ